jgi:hypothetical protein
MFSDIDDPSTTVIKITMWDENKYEEHEVRHNFHL